jgi:outer membrane protein TolC
MVPRLPILVLAALLSGCTLYHPAPLPDAADLAPGIGALPGEAAPDHALDMRAVATLAVLHSPDLVALRAKSGVASAQAFAAGLLPDPQLTASVDHPSAAGFVNGYALGLSEDLQALLTAPARAESAQATADAAKLNALWDEWQTIDKACTLYVQKVSAENKTRVLGETARLLSDQAARSSRAMSERSATLDQAGADLAAAMDTESQRNTAERDVLTADINLKSLLDLRPDSALQLLELGDPPPLTHDQVVARLATVAKARPDLLALRAGYHAQEEAVRIAVLSQFPSITFGGNHQADTSNVHTVGLSVSINLPIFNGARGEIAIQHATRAQLRAEYQARLDQTTADAWRLWQESELLLRQLSTLESRIPEFRRMAETSRAAYRNGDLAPATYVLMQTTLTARESELIDLRVALWNDTIALHTLLGTPYLSVDVAKRPGT